MSPEERQLLVGLFERIKNSASAPRDQEAEAFIIDQIRAQPAAPYSLAQTLIIQDHALQGANQRIQQLEAKVKELEANIQKGAGSFLSGGAATLGVSAPLPPPPAPPQGYNLWRDNLSEKSATIGMRCCGRGVGMIVGERQ